MRLLGRKKVSAGYQADQLMSDDPDQWFVFEDVDPVDDVLLPVVYNSVSSLVKSWQLMEVIDDPVRVIGDPIRVSGDIEGDDLQVDADVDDESSSFALG